MIASADLAVRRQVEERRQPMAQNTPIPRGTGPRRATSKSQAKVRRAGGPSPKVKKAHTQMPCPAC